MGKIQAALAETERTIPAWYVNDRIAEIERRIEQLYREKDSLVDLQAVFADEQEDG